MNLNLKSTLSAIVVSSLFLASVFVMSHTVNSDIANNSGLINLDTATIL